MPLGWFDAREATDIGVMLADQFVSRTLPPDPRTAPLQRRQGEALREFLQRAERAVHSCSLNFYKKAKLANAFKWRLLEKGIEGAAAAEVTHTLITHLSMRRLAAAAGSGASAARPTKIPRSARNRDLMADAARYVAQGAYGEAVGCYQALLARKPRHPVALNDLGAAYWKLGDYARAEEQFRHAIRIKPNGPGAHSNLGSILRGRGHLAASENSLRRALKLDPGHMEARVSLGLTLIALGRPADAKIHLDRALKVAPNHVAALLGLAQVAATEGRFDAADAAVRRAVALAPNEPSAWAALPPLRRMTTADSAWLERAQAIVDAKTTPLQEADLRFAMGKYCDDVGDYRRAFENYRRANELLKTTADPYDREFRNGLVDDLVRVYTRGTLNRSAPVASDSPMASPRPVFVVGMMRSGTSLVEQIIASHPAAAGAGELRFWAQTMRRHDTDIRSRVLPESLRTELARDYLRELARHGGDARAVVDKAPDNSDLLGVIHSVFPNARIIHVQRDPVDTCLSGYFQSFSAALNFTMDLSDLAHYCRTHQCLMSHWRSVLPEHAMLQIHYEDLIADQERWTRRILDFLGLEWDSRCLSFEATPRTVATASAWQVRQKIYNRSVGRWHHYEKFIEPLLELRDCEP